MTENSKRFWREDALPQCPCIDNASLRAWSRVGQQMNTEDEQIDVALMVLPRREYEDLRFEDGKPLTDLFPERIYCSIIPSPFQVLEIAPELTGRMRAMGFTENVTQTTSWLDSVLGAFDNDPLYPLILECEREARRLDDEHFTPIE